MFGKTKKLVMCQACRGLIDSSMRICPLCGRDSVPDAPVRLRAADEHSQFFTKLVLGINVVVFLIMTAVATSGGNTRAFFSGVSGPQLVDFGGKYFPLIRDGQVWRLVSANFLHIGIMHLGFNCFALYQIGPLVEEAYGSQKFIFIYLVTGVLGFTLSSFYDPSTPSAGASASLMGLIGVTAVYGHRIGGTGGRALMRQMLMWAAITLGIGLFGLLSMDNSAHVGGLAGGAVLGFLMKPEQPSTAGSASLWNVVSLGCALVIVGSFAMVGLQYGDQQRGQDIITLDRRILQLNKALERSYKWEGPNDGDPAKIASDLRSAAADFEPVKRIDSETDSIKKQYVAMAKARADLFDNAAKDPTAVASAALKDESDASALYQRYLAWFNSVKDKYGLVMTRQESPQ